MSGSDIRGTPAALGDGRMMIALKGTYTQERMFRLRRTLPENESIMGLKGLDEAANVSGAARALPFRGGWWRTSDYGVYARGFETDMGTPVGAEIIWVEDGYRYAFEVPDVRHPHDRNKGLRQSSGLLVFALGKLRYQPRKRLVTVAADFDPENEVLVKDVMPDGWAIPDADGYPIRSCPSCVTAAGARGFRFVPSGGFEPGSSGWHGSISMLIAPSFEYARRVVDAHSAWRYPSGVSVARSPPAEPSDTLASGK